jgi:hypothetical protein
VPSATATKIRHEDFCLPRPGANEPRIESFKTYSDDPGTGRSRPTHMVLRCLECGAATYQQIGT